MFLCFLGVQKNADFFLQGMDATSIVIALIFYAKWMYLFQICIFSMRTWYIARYSYFAPLMINFDAICCQKICSVIADCFLCVLDFCTRDLTPYFPVSKRRIPPWRFQKMKNEQGVFLNYFAIFSKNICKVASFMF